MYLYYFLTTIKETYVNPCIQFSSFFISEKFLSRIILRQFTNFEKFLKAINSSKRGIIFRKYYHKCKMLI